MSWAQCYIGLGSNLGDSEGTLNASVKALKKWPEIRQFEVSSYYQSKPHGPPDQPDYINAVAAFETQHAPLALLDLLQSLEAEYGRVRTGERWSARTLDLDILLFGDQVIDTPRLTVPHPCMKMREFVLYPLFELAPDLCFPDGRLLRDCLSDVSDAPLLRLQ